MRVPPRPHHPPTPSSPSEESSTVTPSSAPSSAPRSTTTAATEFYPSALSPPRDARSSLRPTPSVPVEQRTGKTTALQALQQRPIGRSFAAIDLGSSSGKMLIGQVTAHGVQIRVDHKIGCALGKDVAVGQPIPAANMDRAIDALRAFVGLAQEHGVDVDSIPLITTAVVRNAENGADFVARVRREIGINVRVLSGLEEADVGFRGALGPLLRTPGRYATIDLGGGSFQLAIGTERGLEDGGSTQVGSNTILDTMIKPRIADDGIVGDDVFAFVDATLKQTAPLPLSPALVQGRTLVATGGVSKFLRVHLGVDVVTRDDIDALRRKLGALSLSERASFIAVGRSDDEKAALGIGTTPGAADYGKKLPASLSLLLHIVDGLKLSELRISSTDARHALLDAAIDACTSR